MMTYSRSQFICKVRGLVVFLVALDSHHYQPPWPTVRYHTIVDLEKTLRVIESTTLPKQEIHS